MAGGAQAIAEINAWASLPSAPTIAFALPGCSSAAQAACSIAPTTVLPSVARAMAIDASTQPGWNSTTTAPLVELSGAVAPANAIGLVVGFGQPFGHSLRRRRVVAGEHHDAQARLAPPW